ncbi:MAG: hypothetical protein QMD82_06560 [bacterium]|nr:hypothetical protein [bacterium]
MKLHEKVAKYICDSTEFDEELAIEIVEFQKREIPFYADFLRVNGIDKIRKISEIPFFPVEFFKKYEIFVGEPENYFESSGTTGNRSRVFYNSRSLELYRISALRSFPDLNIKHIYSFVPDFKVANRSSLAYMLKIFEEKYKVIYLNDSYEIEDFEKAVRSLEEVEESSVLFFTSSQLLRVSEYMIEKGVRFAKKLIIIETGGYKALKRRYIRSELYSLAGLVFENSEFYTEYGMTELFSQFYSVCKGIYKEHPYAKILTEGEGLLKVFDFANLYTVSALLVPDRVVVKGRCFDVLGRVQEDERGCAFTFR